MAIAFVSKGTSVQASTATITLNKPSTTNLDDVIVAAFMIVSTTTTVTGIPTGFTLLESQTGTNCGLFVYVKKATSSEPSTYVWNLSIGTLHAGGTADYSGVDVTAAPYTDCANAKQAPGSSNSHDCLAVTTATDHAMAIAVVGVPTANTTETEPATLTQRIDVEEELNTSGYELALGDHDQTPAGSTGIFTWTPSAKTTYASITFALKPIVTAVADIPDLTMAPLGRAS